MLARPFLYEAFSALVGGRGARTALIEHHVRPGERDRILDLGCGPGELRSHLPAGVRYVGVDISQAYIDRARERFPGTAEFRTGDATALDDDLRDFDIVLGVGFLHHLDDGQAAQALRGAARALAPSGRMVTIDPTFTDPQSRLARAVIRRDRGQHVREPDSYRELAETAFGQVTLGVRTDLLRIPYTHAVLECEQPLPSPGLVPERESAQQPAR